MCVIQPETPDELFQKRYFASELSVRPMRTGYTAKGTRGYAAVVAVTSERHKITTKFSAVSRVLRFDHPGGFLWDRSLLIGIS